MASNTSEEELIMVYSGIGLRTAALQCMANTSNSFLRKAFAQMCREPIEEVRIVDMEGKLVAIHRDYVPLTEQVTPEDVPEYDIDIWWRQIPIMSKSYSASTPLSIIQKELTSLFGPLSYKGIIYLGIMLDPKEILHNILFYKKTRLFISGASEELANWIMKGVKPFPMNTPAQPSIPTASSAGNAPPSSSSSEMTSSLTSSSSSSSSVLKPSPSELPTSQSMFRASRMREIKDEIDMVDYFDDLRLSNPRNKEQFLRLPSDCLFPNSEELKKIRSSNG